MSLITQGKLLVCSCATYYCAE